MSYTDHDDSCNRAITQIYDNDNGVFYMYCVACGAENTVPTGWLVTQHTSMLIENLSSRYDPDPLYDEEPW